MDFTIIIIRLNQIRISLGMAMDGSLIQLIENFLSTAAVFTLYRCVVVEDVSLVTKRPSLKKKERRSWSFLDK